MGMMKEDNEFMSPKPPSSGINFNPSLSNKFRKRMFDKPLQLNLGGINRGSNIVLASARFEENDNRNEVPNIHKTLKNAANFKNSKLNKILQDQSKGSSTSRNRNHNINQSFNAVPRLKENFLMGPGAGKINFSGFQRENMDLGGLANSLDMSARSSRNKFFSPPAEGRESMMTLQRKVGELKEVLADRESQVETLKRNIRSNQIDTLKNENNMLYAKCRRLQKIICIMMDKTKDTDLGFETELMIEIEEALRDPSLKVKIKTSMNKMTSLQEHNNKLTKELEEMRRMLNEKDRKSTFTKDDDLLDSNEESKDESNQKSKINRGETKIIKHKSGSGAKTKKVIAFNKNLKDIDGQKLNSRINAGKSEKQFLERGSDDSSAETITENQISESLAELRLLLQVFESKSIKFLFGDKYSVDIEAAKEIFSSKLNLGTNQANKLSRFLIESKPIEGLQNKSSNLSCQEIMNKIESVVGKYRKYSANDIQELIESFYSPQNDCYRSRFITEMDDLIHAEKVSKNEFEKTVTNLNLDINIKTLIIMLMRESNSMSTITGGAIQKLIDRIKNLSKSFKRPDDQYGSNMEIEVSNLENEDDEAQMRNSQLEMNLNHNFFVRLAEFVFSNDLTLYQIIHPKIYDKMFNGNEYELINSKSFFKILEQRGLRISAEEKNAVTNLLKSSNLIDVFEVDKILKILEELDIKEDIPNPSKNFDYKHLSAPDIRIINRVIKYMDDNSIEDVEDFIGKSKISVVEVIGNNKTEDIHILNAQDFTDILIEKNCLEDEEVCDGLQMFFAVSIDNIDKLMVRKIKKCIKDFKTVKFFKYYGTEFRSEESVLSDIEEDLPVVTIQ